MLDKDQYNQDEYNNYYKQEIEGAEIKGFENNENGFLKKAILLLGVAALGVAGFFGFKFFNNSTNSVESDKIVIKEEPSNKIETNNKKSVEEKVIESIKNNAETTKETEDKIKSIDDKIEKRVQEEVATQVQEKLEANQKMSSDDISKIVNIVMSKMEKEKKTEPKESDKDIDLLSALEKSDQDNAEPEKTKQLDKSKIVTTDVTPTDKKLEIDSNKVTVENNTQNKNSDLTELSEQIKKLLNMAGASDEPKKSITKQDSIDINTSSTPTTLPDYESSISKEIEVRTNEMRIIIVKPGDTLNKIAKRAYGDASSYQKIFDANPSISRADKIYVGQKLRIPE